MTIGAVGSTAATDSQVNSLGLQDFLNILLTQLTYQDPLKPMDNQQFMAQMAQFTALQQAQETNSKIDQLVASQSVSQSVGLLGRTVDFVDASGTRTGVVSALSFAAGTPALTVALANGQRVGDISLGQVAAVR
jgi:flagellar basal-body rod modification protein FlgD